MPIAVHGALRKLSALLNRLKPRVLFTGKRLLVFLICLGVLVFVIDRFAPPRHLPWKPLDMEAPIGIATGVKLTLISFAPSSVCLNTLQSAQHLDYAQVPPKRNGKCGWDIAAAMTQSSNINFRPSTVTTQCPLMVASYIWLRAVDKAAQNRLGSGLKTIHHAGTYSCRRQRGNASGTWSEHAFANAWDITGFELRDGRVISVLKHWNAKRGKESKAKAKFLHDARKSACRVFRVVLTPDFNAAHKDHFHLDQGPSLSCR